MTNRSQLTLLVDHILEAARIGENDDWEFKSAKGGLPGSLWESYSAMGNSAGGTIVLGAREEPSGVALDGLAREKIDGFKKILWDGLNNRSTVSRNLIASGDIEAVPVDSGWLLAIRVPQARRTERPVYKGQNPFGGTFKRRHEGDYRCPDEEIRRMFADASDTPADARVLEGFGLDDLDEASLNEYRNLLAATKGAGHPWAAFEYAGLLEQLGGWRKDRESGAEGITLAGILMFGKFQAIVSPGAAPKYALDYRDYRGRSPEERWGDRLFSDGTWEANLFQFYRRCWPKLVSDLKVPFVLRGAQRIDETPVHISLREAFGNALIHTDYSVGGGVVIERHDERYQIENAGTLLVSQEQLRRGSVSECRNRSLQRMFMMIGVGEQAGSGYARIQDGWKSQHWRAPRLTTQYGPDRVRLDMPMISLMPQEIFSTLRQKLGRAFDDLNEVERLILATALIEGEVTNTRMQELVSDHSSDLTKLLRGLVAQGLLAHDKQRRWTRYWLPSSIVPRQDLFSGATQGNGRTGSPHKGADSPHTGLDSPRNEGDSPRMGADSPLNEVEIEALRPIAEPVSKQKRASTEKLRTVILDLCRGRFLTADQLANLCKRDIKGLRDRTLSKMIQEGLLRHRYPDQPNRPDQAYTSTEEAA